ncbi:uncharacterized protein RB166_019519 isoform 1-T1 [Leptodactylus fuscus]|uniref:uncharacterized protein LOC142184521 isoform X1 n=1 Tax=Leptodactylus fuscus TaxID=238119 RepID=UPI003F4EEB1D
MALRDMDHWEQERWGPVEDDELEGHRATRNVAEEHDDSTDWISSIAPLRSQDPAFMTDFRWPPDVEEHHNPTEQTTCTYPDLQISLSATDFCWSPAVLSAFDNLPPLNSEDVTTLNSFLGLPLTSQPKSVKDFLVTFQSHTDNYNMLRKLAEQLKSLGREDIVRAMHRERRLLRWLGPMLSEEHLIKDIVPSLWTPLTVKLSLSHPNGYDWKWLAAQLAISRDFIDLWQQQGGVPADNVLKTWQVKVSEATVGRLFDLLIEQREDLAALL